MGNGWRLVAAAAGLTIVLSGCARPPVSRAPSPVAQASPSSGLESPSAAESPTAVASPVSVASPSTAPASPALLTIPSATFHVGEVNIAYSSVGLGASGGYAPFRWTISVGSLPTGLSLSTGGVVSGTPSGAGGFPFTVRVADAVGDSAIVNRSITVVPYLMVSGKCVNVCAVEQGCVTVCGAYVSIAGGVTPYTYQLAGGSLPPGTSLSGPALGGTFTTVSAAAPFSFAVLITDAFGATGKVASNFDFFAHITFTVTSANCAPTVAAFTCTTSQLQYAGGTPGGTPTVKVAKVVSATGQLPLSFSAIAKGGTVIVTASTQKTNYTGTVTLILIDQSPCGPQGNCQSNLATVTIKI